MYRRLEARLETRLLPPWLERPGQAVYHDNGDGTFTVTTHNLVLSGKKGSDKVDISYKGAPLGSWSIDGTIRALIDGAKHS